MASPPPDRDGLTPDPSPKGEGRQDGEFTEMNFAQLSGADLDRAIAELLGWTELELVETWIDERDIGYTTFQIWHGRLNGLEADVPQFHADTNAQLRLCVKRRWQMTYISNEEANLVRPLTGEYVQVHGGKGADYREAGARALLAALMGAK